MTRNSVCSRLNETTRRGSSLFWMRASSTRRRCVPTMRELLATFERQGLAKTITELRRLVEG